MNKQSPYFGDGGALWEKIEQRIAQSPTET